MKNEYNICSSSNLLLTRKGVLCRVLEELLCNQAFCLTTSLTKIRGHQLKSVQLAGEDVGLPNNWKPACTEREGEYLALQEEVSSCVSNAKNTQKKQT